MSSKYKDTLNILKTNFEMKANLKVNEPIFQKFWIEKKIYEQLLNQNKKNDEWILHDGPPYANGDIHIGHALNKIIKDIIIRWKTMQGYYSPYIPGWDTHGLPIEHALIAKGINTNPLLTINQKRDNCKNFALQNIEKQKQQFMRLGLLSDFNKIYCTFDNDYEHEQLLLFFKAIEKQLIYQDFKPVYWSWSSLTALADAEIEYQDVESTSIFFSFVVNSNNLFLKKGDRLIVWTTTPWTIPSNLAICVHPKHAYLKFKVNDQCYVVVKKQYETIIKKLNFNEPSIINEFYGKDIEGVSYEHPLYITKSLPIILDEYVSDTDGTGLVHNAPGFGLEDYRACKKYNIQPFVPIDKYGKFNKEINDDQLEGIFYEKANPLIIERLNNSSNLLKSESIVHSIAIDWRTKKPVIYRATKQWFINIDAIKNELVNEINEIKFINIKNKKRLLEMVTARPEWCISRQRIWGVPIPIIYDENDQPIFDYELITNIINILKNESTNTWFEKPVEYFLTNKYKNHKNFKKEIDTMDVWFDSGTSWSNLKLNKLSYPANLYFEGNDQYRGWFNSSLINSVIGNKIRPYKTLLSHGFVLDKEGKKMSKSLGNIIDPINICNEYGADILRIACSMTNYQIDIKFSNEMLKLASETYRRIRNTLFKFILSNISDYHYDENKYTINEVDQRIIYELNENIKLINIAYEQYDFSQVIRIINDHTIKLSSWYFDIIKDALYCEEVNNLKRRGIQKTLFQILYTYLIFLNPIIPHTCEEAYKFLIFNNKKESINFEKWIFYKDQFIGVDMEKWQQFDLIRTNVNSELEKLRNKKEINKSNEAFIEISFDNKFNFLEKQLAFYLNVAQVKITNCSGEWIKVNAKNAHLNKCERCWNYYEKIDMHDEHICKRCNSIINKQTSNSI